MGQAGSKGRKQDVTSELKFPPTPSISKPNLDTSSFGTTGPLLYHSFSVEDAGHEDQLSVPMMRPSGYTNGNKNGKFSKVSQDDSVGSSGIQSDISDHIQRERYTNRNKNGKFSKVSQDDSVGSSGIQSDISDHIQRERISSRLQDDHTLISMSGTEERMNPVSDSYQSLEALSCQVSLQSQTEVSELMCGTESISDEYSSHDQPRSEVYKCPASSNYLDGNLTNNRMTEKQTDKAAAVCAPLSQRADTNMELESVGQTTSVNETSSGNQTYPDDISSSVCVIMADTSGVNFVCTTFCLKGSISEGAIPDGESRELHITKHDRTLYQSSIADGRFISDVYECMPHRMKFKEPILIQFPYQTETLPGRATTVLRRCVIYSNTDASESPNWEIVKAQDVNISCMIAGEMCHLFVSSFCLFGVVEYNIPVMYIDMMVFGKFYHDANTCKVTVVLTQQMDATVKLIDHYGKALGYGDFITEKPIRLVKDVKQLELSLDMDPPDLWDCLHCYEDIDTHCLWENTQCTSTFGVKIKSSFDSIEKTLFRGKLTARHNGEEVVSFILESTEQMTPKNRSIQEETQIRQGVEHSVRSECSSESVIPKVCNSLTILPRSSESMMPKQLRKETVRKTEPAKGNMIYEHKTNCEVNQWKLPKSIKCQLAEILDESKEDGTDWRALANQLGYGHYGSGFYTGKTKHLLLLWEAETGKIGTVEYLIEALKNINQQPLARIIQNFCKPSEFSIE